ncbi:hypothetical protein HZF24_11920 [Sedimentibacter hydroxybenzoicus DSM 7310]|uniref:Uncharacterized protein n=1 Tax=Sedimentibacter hydroxybenzoicus DSM 7310 TaxID=1123245 RepID=A0A974GX96_SEDHY|nr:hypothetical protein [Sedimentibacter hydroxybenzoicus]NYB74845.1 hypothetical protein [Sedimentibacter hydroxybenzoicus DSM 7310]
MAKECYQCLDAGIVIIRKTGKNGTSYNYMFQCSCRRGSYHGQLPSIDIKSSENRNILKELAHQNYELLNNGIRK